MSALEKPVTLYDLDAELQELEDVLSDPEISDEEKEHFIQTWLVCMDRVSDKLDGYAALIRTLEARALVYKVEEDHFKAKRQSAEKNADRLKATLMGFMLSKTPAWEKVPTKRFELRVCRNGGKAPVLIACEATDLPEIYRRVTVEPDKEAIRADLEQGLEVPGCAIGERGRYLKVV